MHYGAHVLTLKPGQKLALLAGLPSALAERELRETRGAGLTLESLYALVLAATGSKVAAEKAMRTRMAAQLRAGQQPE